MEASKDVGVAAQSLKATMGIIHKGDFSMEKIE
jgi:hypothetical protein